MARLRVVGGVFALLAVVFALNPARAANPPEVDRGLSWLNQQVLPSGALASEGQSVATPLQSRAETLATLAQLATPPSSVADAVAGEPADATEYLARRIVSLAPLGRDVAASVATLQGMQNADGGFGAAAGYPSNALDTAYALLAFKAAAPSSSAVPGAVNALVALQSADGSFQIDEQASLFITAMSLRALTAYASSYALSTSLQSARAWLVSQQSSGGYASALDNAVAALAISASTLDTTLFAGAQAALKGTQAADGSWGGDPFVTALAIRALMATASAPPPATTGQISGSVVSKADGSAIAGATVQASGPQSATATTDSNGAFVIANLAPGTYSVQVLKVGYDTYSQTVGVQAGVASSTGTIRLQAATTTASLVGNVRDGTTNAAIAGATVQVSSGGTATTDASGHYELAGLVPGTATVTVSKSGYQSATASITFTAGVVTAFAPALYAGTAPTDATLRGTVIDAATQQPVAGATVTAGGASATTGSTGTFSIAGLAAGSTSIVVSATGYVTTTYSASLALGVNDVGNVAIAKQPASVTITGTVSDSASGAPLGGATVQVVGTALGATTSSTGLYTISGVTQTQLTLTVAAPGYQTRTVAVTLPALADSTVDIALDKVPSNGLSIQRVAADAAAYDPYTNVDLAVDVRSTSATDVFLFFSTEVVDATGSVVMTIPGIVAQLAANTVTTVPLETHLTNQAAGNYALRVSAYQADGSLQLQGSTSIAVNAVKKLSGGITLDPPILQAGTGQPVHITANLSNLGNLPIVAGNAQLTVTLNAPDTSVPPHDTNELLPLALVGSPLNYAMGAAFDTAGNFYTVNNNDRKVLRMAPDGQVTVVTTLATQYPVGTTTVTTAPMDLRIDAAGNILILNRTSYVLKVTSAGAVSTVRTNLPGVQQSFDVDATGAMTILVNDANIYKLGRLDAAGNATVSSLPWLNHPTGMVPAPDGSFYVLNYNDGSISRMTADGQVTPFATGLNFPAGLAIDAAGTMYVVNAGNRTISKVSSTGVVTPYVTSGLPSGLASVAIDGSGTLYLTSTVENSVWKVPASGVPSRFSLSLVGAPYAMQYDGAGNLYIAGQYGDVVKLDPSDTVTPLATGLSSPKALVLGPNNDVFVAGNNGRITRTSSSGTTTFATAPNAVTALAYDGTGTFYYAESGISRITRLDNNGAPAGTVESMGSLGRDTFADAAGNRFILGPNQISRLPADGSGLQVIASSGFNAISFIGSADGGFYVQESNAVRKVSAAGAVTALNTQLPSLGRGIALDATGAPLVVDTSGHRILRIDPSTGASTAFATISGNSYAYMVGDGTGGAYLSFYGGLIQRVTASGAVSTFVSNAPYISYMALDAVGSKMYIWSLTDRQLSVLDMQTLVRTPITITAPLDSPGSVESVRFFNGAILVSQWSPGQVVSVTPQGSVSVLVSGFGAPISFAWDGAQLWFTDASRLYSVQPGQSPKIVLNSGAQQLAVRNGTVYYASYTVFAFTPGVDTGWRTYLPQSSYWTGITFRSDGAMALASPYDSHVEIFDANKQSLASYASLPTPAGIALDAANNVYVASRGNSQIVRLDPTGKRSSVLVYNLNTTALRASGSGLIAQSLYGPVLRIGLDGTQTQIGTSSSTLNDIAEGAGQVYGTDNGNGMVRQLSGTDMVPFATGVASPGVVALNANNELMIPNGGNGTVVRVRSGATVEPVARGLQYPLSITRWPNGDMLVGGNYGLLYKIKPDGSYTTVDDLSGVFAASRSATFMAAGPDNVLAVNFRDQNEIRRYGYHPAQPLPAPGTVVLQKTAAFAGLPIDTYPLAVDFGSWTPPYGGDFTLSIQTGDASGSPQNVLHVGPNATGQIAVAKATVPPGTSPVDVSVNVAGADFTTLAKVDGSNVSIAVATGVYPHAMGADASGNVYAITGSDVRLLKFTSGGVQSTLYSVPAGQTLDMRGSIPVDDAQNVYIIGTGTRTDILKVDPNGNATKLATLPEGLRSLARAQGDVIYALSGVKIYRVAKDGTYTVKAAYNNGFAITVDGYDNVYVQDYNNHIAVFHPDGTSANVIPASVSQPGFEYEGMNIAGDCADNLFATPIGWSLVGQSGEEHTLVQIVGRTGVIAQILDGTKLNPQLTDLDFIVYDRFTQSLLMWTDLSGGRMYRIPVTCGAISTDLHLVFPPSQPVNSTSIAPKTILTRTDGSHEYVWSLKDVTNLGKVVNLSTTLSNLKLGDVAPIAAGAFLVFQNSFVAGDVTVPLKVPTVGVDGMVDLAVATDQPQYPENTDVLSTVHLANRDALNAKSGTLRAEITDAQGVSLLIASQGAVTIPANGALDVAPPFNTGTYLAGSYRVKATLTDASGMLLTSGQAGFDIVPSGVTLVSSVSTDKQAYGAVDTVNITGRVSNVSVNAVVSSLALQLAVTAPDGSTAFTGSASISILVPQAFRDNAFAMKLSGAAAGTYTVTQKVTDGSGTVLDTRTAQFTVLSTADTGSGLRGAVSATHFANTGDPVTLTATLSDVGNAALTNLAITFRVVNPANGQAVFTAPATVTVPLGGALTQAIQTWSTPGIAAGVYVATASATFQGREISLGQDHVTIGAIQPFAFAPRTNVPLNAIVESDAVIIAGIVAPAPISVAGGEYRIDDGGWTGALGSVMPGQKVTVRVEAAGTYNATASAALTIAGYTASFDVTTVNPDITPDAFTFTAQSNVPLASLRTSNAVTITGIDIPVPISIAGGLYSINGGAFTAAAGQVASGDVVTVQLTSAGTLGTTTSATLTVSSVTGAFTVTTTAEDRTPDPFAFAPQSPVPVSTLRTSNTVTVTGINVAVPVSVAGGEYSINGGAFTSAPGTIANGSTVTVRHTSSASFSTTVTTKLTVSDFTAVFESTTEGEDSVPDPFAFADDLGVPLQSLRTSNSVTITGINTPVPITVSGGEYSVNGGPYTSAAGTVKSNDTVTVRQTSSASFDTATVAKVTVSQVSGTFTVRTKAKADVTAKPMFQADARVLVLLACKIGGVDDADDDTACLASRQAFLDSYLANLGIDHRIVTATEDFRAWFRSGRYDTYWISGGAKKLLDTLAPEVREAAFRGETLVVDGVHDQRNGTLDEALGMLYKGKPTGLDTVTLTGSVVPSGDFAVNGTRALRTVLTTAVRQARFNTGDPAIATNLYGAGKGLLFAFDLTGTLQAQAASALLRDLVDQSLAYVAPHAPAAYTGGEYVPLTADFRNSEPVAVDLVVTATLPSGFSVASGAPPATVAGSTVTWSFSVPANGTATVDWALRTPEASGSYTVPLDVQQAYAGTTVELATVPIALTVSANDTRLAAVTAQVAALGVTTVQETKARGDTVAALNDAKNALAASNWISAIASLVQAADAIGAISSIDVTAYQVSIDEVLKETQRRWWSALPTCPATPPCRGQ